MDRHIDGVVIVNELNTSSLFNPLIVLIHTAPKMLQSNSILGKYAKFLVEHITFITSTTNQVVIWPWVKMPELFSIILKFNCGLLTEFKGACMSHKGRTVENVGTLATNPWGTRY